MLTAPRPTLVQRIGHGLMQSQPMCHPFQDDTSIYFYFYRIFKDQTTACPIMSNDYRLSINLYSLHINVTANVTTQTLRRNVETQTTTSPWWRMTGSNRRPPACKAGALPAELIPRIETGGSGWVRTNDPRLIKTVL